MAITTTQSLAGLKLQCLLLLVSKPPADKVHTLRFFCLDFAVCLGLVRLLFFRKIMSGLTVFSEGIVKIRPRAVLHVTWHNSSALLR